MPLWRRGAQASDVLCDVADLELRSSVRQIFADAQQLIDSGRVQAVVLAARRLACLYQLLAEAGEVELRGAEVLSDRSIDFSLDPSSRGVLILDDSVVLGTTLDGLTARVRLRCPDAEVLVRCVVVDEQQKASFLLDQLQLESLALRDSVAVSEFSEDIVKSLYRQQVPFFSDFPVSARVQVDRDTWLNHLRKTDWLLADVTPPLVDDAGLQGLAHVPTDSARTAMLTRLQPELAELLDSAKVRCYSKVLEDGSLDVVMVPIVLLAPASVEAVHDSVAAVLKMAAAEDVAWPKWGPETQQRFLQYVASCCLLADYSRDFGPMKSDDVTELLAPVPYRLFFGSLGEQMRPVLGAIVEAFMSTPPHGRSAPVQLRPDQPSPSPLLTDRGVQERLFEARELLAGLGVPPRPDLGELTKIGLIFSHAISAVFGYVDRTLEAEQRSHIQAMASHAEYQAWMATGPGRVLNQGLTLAELTRSLVPETVASDPWARALVSFGLDIGNDLGIIVPVTRVDDERGVVYRCYRLGETAFLAGPSRLVDLLTAGGPDALPPMFTLADRDYPITSVVGQVETSIPTRRGPYDSARDFATDVLNLRLAVLEATPGTLVEGWEGTVVGLSDGFLEVNVTPVPRGAATLARLPLEWVGQARDIDARAGRPIVWSIWERDSSSGKSRTNRVRLLPVPPIDLERARAVGEHVALLLQDDD